MKYLALIMVLLILGCGEYDMAKIGEEVETELVATNVTDSTQYYNASAFTFAASENFNFYYVNNGILYSKGYNGKGQLGLGNTTDFSTFQNTGISEVKSVFSGFWLTMIIKEDGTLWATGENSQGRFGNSTLISTTSFVDTKITNVRSVSITQDFVLILKNDGTVWKTGNYTLRPIDMLLTNIIKIAVGRSHALAIDTEGKLFVYGDNTYGQLGMGDNIFRYVFEENMLLNTFSNKVIDISAGFYHSAILQTGGILYTTGKNESGQLGVNDLLDKNSPTLALAAPILKISCSSYGTILTKNDNSVWGTGTHPNYLSSVNTIIFTNTSISNIAEITAGYESFAILTTAGELAIAPISDTYTYTAINPDTHTSESWKYFYNEDEVRVQTKKYFVGVLTTFQPSPFVALTEIGNINQYRPFDEANISAAIATSPMTYTIRGLADFNSFSLAKVKATSITYTFKNSLGATIKTDTRAINCSRDTDGILSQYPTTIIIYADVQMEANSTVEISISNTEGDIELGSFNLNNTVDIGFTDLEFSHENQDWNSYTPDAFGNIQESTKPITTVFNISLSVLIENYDLLVSYSQSVLGKNVIIDGSDSNGLNADGSTIFSSLTRRGRISNFRLKNQVKDGDMEKIAKASMTFKEIV